MSRSLRRHHVKRIKEKCKNYYAGNLSGRDLGMVSKTRKLCGCWMCSNARKLEGITFQEKKVMQPRYDNVYFEGVDWLNSL